ncbi:superoxide dismutase family protein [Thermobifida cellulosilytica]|uniref:Superoxide dismutase n=1 Tax=Thermobifida cellulosilytica TB100 TaxID=665004 RepID=A0A147KL21_THECS|nr:superoxide dismutase family protein [Thermobifida cellulosilytica]KUP97987.1 hypothetical protein AC529_03270 [Thermobifida cellulosilytica TB100]
MRTPSTVAAAALSLLLLTGCGSFGEEAPEPSHQVEAAFETWSEGAEAVTYDPANVPEGATVKVTITPVDSGSDIALTVEGLVGDRDYGAHLHTKPCGENPEDAGPHYQNEPAPDPSTPDPDYANPQNEAWLDFHTDAEGRAHSQTSVSWTPRDGEANSVVIHAERTQTVPVLAGTAGEPLACVTIPQ